MRQPVTIHWAKVIIYKSCGEIPAIEWCVFTIFWPQKYTLQHKFMVHLAKLQKISFLSKIQNRTREKTVKKILLIYGKISSLWFFLPIFESTYQVFPSNFWNTTIIWRFFRVILNFAQECETQKQLTSTINNNKSIVTQKTWHFVILSVN